MARVTWSVTALAAPRQGVNPVALRVLGAMGGSRVGVQSKHWDTFLRESAPVMDYVITVCDNAAGEVCPVWPGHPATAHWGFPDPSDSDGGDEAKRAAFNRVFNDIKLRIQFLVSLPVAKLAHLALSNELKRIHREAAVATSAA